MKLAASIAALGLLVSPAAAEEAKSPEQALAFSGGVTLLSGILVAVTAQDDEISPVTAAGVAGLVLGPSLGHVYAGDYLTGGLALRAAGMTGAMLGYRWASCGDTGDCNAPAGVAIMVASAGAFAAGIVWDIATASRAAHRWNERHGITLTPTITPDDMGVSLAGSF